jgi:hypothetical protein
MQSFRGAPTREPGISGHELWIPGLRFAARNDVWESSYFTFPASFLIPALIDTAASS